MKDTKLRFIITFIIILLTSVAAFYAVSMPRNTGSTLATDGTLDLTGADLTNTLYPLDGQWEFYAGKLYTPDDFVSGIPGDMEIAVLPCSWEDLGYTEPHFGTFRLTLKTGTHKRLMLHIPEIAEAGVAWLNGDMVYEAGVPGEQDVFVSSIQNAFVSLNPENGITEIVIQAASGRMAQSGLTYSMWVGCEDLLLQDTVFRRVALMGVIGAILMMALYHFVLFLSHPRDKIYLWYVLYALTISLRMSMETDGLVQYFAPNGMGNLLIGVYLALFSVNILFIALFTFEALGIPYLPRKTVWRVVYGLCGGIFITNILFYLINPNTPISLSYLNLLPIALLVAAAAWKVFKDKQKNYTKLYFLALCLFLIWGTGAKLFADNTLYMPMVLSNMFMALAQTVVLAFGYAEAKRREKELTAETQFYRRMSHDMRTPLTKISTNIQIANRQSQTDHGRLTKSQDEIMRLSEMIDAALDDSSESGVNK